MSCEDVPKCAAPLCHSTLKGFSITTAPAAEAEINLQLVRSGNECQIKHELVAQTIVLFKGATWKKKKKFHQSHADAAWNSWCDLTSH